MGVYASVGDGTPRYKLDTQNRRINRTSALCGDICRVHALTIGGNLWKTAKQA